MKLTKTEQLKAIDRAFGRLCGCCEHTEKWDRYLALIEQEEKGHRLFKPDGLSCGLTKAQSVRLFAVKEVFERFVVAHAGEKPWTPEAKDFFSVKHSVFGAVAIADLCKAEIVKAFKASEMREWLDSVDYCELNKDPRTVREEIAA